MATPAAVVSGLGAPVAVPSFLPIVRSRDVEKSMCRDIGPPAVSTRFATPPARWTSSN